MRTTQKDIAKELGVSLLTVSRALNGTGYVSAALKKRILSYAKEQNYVPHKASQVLVRNKIQHLALFSSTLPHYFWNDIHKGIAIAAEQIAPFDYVVRYHNVEELNTEAYISLIKEEIEKGLDAVGFVNQRKYDMKRIIETIREANIPYITFNADSPECGRLRYIGSNYASGGALVADYIGSTLLHAPKKRVLVINVHEHEKLYSETPDINAERLSGFIEVMDKKYPHISYEVVNFSTSLGQHENTNELEQILRSYHRDVEAVYLIPAFNTSFLKSLKKVGCNGLITILHDIDANISTYLRDGTLTAAVYQNPVLQGYYAVKTLEEIVESKRTAPLQDIEIIHNLVLSENMNLLDSGLTRIF
jgi:LacI family transcriptional regulator